MSLVVWGRGRTANVQKVLWALDEIGINFEHRNEGYPAKDEADAAYLQMKRESAFLPVIEDDGFMLWEANAIVRYVADKWAKSPLWPETPSGRASAGRWMDYQLSTIRGYIHPLLRESGSAEEVKKRARQLGDAMMVLERRLEKQDYLVGSDFTLGDIPLGIVAFRWLVLDIPRPASPATIAWCERLGARPAFQARVHAPLETATPLRA